MTEDTSLGFVVIDFAHDILGMTLMPWQRWLLIHALELTEDNRFRFRNVLVLVARQNGKTTLLTVLALFWLFVEQVPLVLGTSTNLDTARESWSIAVEQAEGNESLQDLIAKNGIRRANGEQEMKTVYGSRYKIAAANRKGGRGLTVARLIADELREHRNWDSWSAASNAMNAVADAQAWCLSNAGDDTSVVLNHFRAAALGGENEAWAIFEWSAPEGCELDDVEGRLQANPAVGHTITMAVLDAAMVMTPTAYRTEILCQHVPALDAAVDMSAWAQTADSQGDLSGSRSRIALCVDISPDLLHCTLVAAAVQGSGKVRVDVVGSWGSPAELRAALPGLLKKVKPRVIGWFPSGPAAALAVDLKDLRKGVEMKATDVTAACQSFAEQVSSGRVLHPNDPLLNAHLGASSKMAVGDGWRFARGDGGQVDAAYAVAGAVHLARTLPHRAGPPRVIAAD